jgi:putative spermidine/putrescine transport system permease protein
MSIAAREDKTAVPVEKSRRRERDMQGLDTPPIFVVLAIIAFALLLLPAIIVVLTGLNSGNYLQFPPQGISLKWVNHFLTTNVFRGAFLFSFGLATAVMIVSTSLGTCAALFLTRVRFHGRSLLRAFFLAPLLLPGVVLGLALYLYYVFTPFGLGGTFTGLAIGHVVVTTPYVIGTVSASLYNFDVSLEEAARSLGAGPLKTFRKITFPLIAPGIAAGSLFAFIVSFGQFDVSLFLSTPNYTPLPIALYNSLRFQFDPTIAAAGVFAILLVITTTLLTSRLVDIRRFGGIKFG